MCVNLLIVINYVSSVVRLGCVFYAVSDAITDFLVKIESNLRARSNLSVPVKNN